MTNEMQVGVMIDWKYRENYIDLHRTRSILQNEFPELEYFEEKTQIVITNANKDIKLKIRADGTFFISRTINDVDLDSAVLNMLFAKAIVVAKNLSLEFPDIIYSNNVYFYLNAKNAYSFYEQAKKCITAFAESVFGVFKVEDLNKYDTHLAFIIRPRIIGVVQPISS